MGFGGWGAWSFFGADGAYEGKSLNVILITADTLRADRLGCCGNTRIATPNLDRLAASGVVFEHTTTDTPLTLPAHSSMFTGTFPMYHGVRDNGGYYLGLEHITLAEILKEQGYTTGAFVAAFSLDPRWGLDQGFDRYFDDFDLPEFEKVSLDSVQRLHCRWVPITFGVEWAHWWGARREETEAAGELWPDPFACQCLPWIRECRELGLSVLVGAGVELPFV